MKATFKGGIYIADEHGNIYYTERKNEQADTMTFTKLSTPTERHQFDSLNEMHDKGIFPQAPGENDRSVAIVKMMLTMGVSVAALPSGIIKHEPGVTILGTSYVINLGSFPKDQHAFWPDDSTTKILLEPETNPPGE